MITKVFEIRDRATFISVLASAVSSYDSKIEAYHMHRNGFAVPGASQVFVTRLNDGQTQYDPYGWPSGLGRTMYEAHEYIQEHFNELPSGAVIDVEYILSETKEPKESEAEFFRREFM